MSTRSMSISLPSLYQNQSWDDLREKSSRLKGPRRVLRFCLLGILVPVFLLALPLYMRFVEYGESSYPLAPSDMRVVDSRVSTTWCQAQVLSMNSSFNAYLVDDIPLNQLEAVGSTMNRTLILEDDMKEYWGFYLLQGSVFTVSACARWPGASMLVVRGRNHLRWCAYIGEMDSDEEPSEEDERRGHATPVDIKRILDKHHLNSSDFNMDHKPGEQWNSKEMMDQIIKQIAELNKKGGNIFDKIRKRLKEQELEAARSNEKPPTERSTVVIDNNFKDPLTLNVTATTTSAALNSTPLFSESNEVNRTKRHVIKTDTSDDSREDGAFEKNDDSERLIPDLPRRQMDGIAADHGSLNLTMGNDKSNSEEESSFSSSEEALAKCEGVIVHIPISPDRQCGVNSNAERAEFSYLVQTPGYYYFIFDSENEITDNLIQLQIDLRRAIYNVENVSTSCRNASECQFDFNFASSQKVVIHIPEPTSKSESWDEVYVVVSTCEPRTFLYLVFALAIPVIILVCAFN